MLAAARTAAPAAAGAPDLHLRRRHAACPRHAAALRVREGRRRLRLQVRVLHHPDAARPLPQPAGGVDRPGSAALAARGVKELLLISQDTTFYGIDRHERGALARSAARAEHGRRPRVDPAALSLPHDDRRRHARGDGGVRQGLQVHRPAAAARVESGAEADEAARDAAELRRACSTGSAHSVPGVALRTTFIVGFPGETEEDVDELSAFVGDHAFDHVGVFTYSHEEGTSAHALVDDVPGAGQDRAAQPGHGPAEAARRQAEPRPDRRAGAGRRRRAVRGPRARS